MIRRPRAVLAAALLPKGESRHPAYPGWRSPYRTRIGSSEVANLLIAVSTQARIVW
jgi:hypothetical protein